MINRFNGEYRFLSNFLPCEIEFEGITYPSVEHAYQAAKTNNDVMRQHVASAVTAGLAKSMGRDLVLRPDWEAVKLQIMKVLLHKKFRDPLLRAALHQTMDEELAEGNYWHDTFWGICMCTSHNNSGENNLGKLLMAERRELVETRAHVLGA